MKRQAWIFAGMVIVACVWSGWLLYQVQIAADPIVVSAPQLHLAPLVVVARVSSQGETAIATIEKVLKDDAKLARVTPLPDKLLVNWPHSFPAATGQSFLLALSRLSMENKDARYEVAPIPRPDRYLPPVVYPFSDSVRLQALKILVP